MNIAIISCENALNYGAKLQTYALSYFLNSIGFPTVVIDYRPDYLSFKEKIIYNPKLSVKEWIKLFIRIGYRINAVLRNNQFNLFSKNFIPKTKIIYRNIEELKKNPPDCDVYIAGSDQIWNPIFPNGTDLSFYLQFGTEKTKKISYAASIAINELNYNQKMFLKKNLSDFFKISVRETFAKKILSELGIKSNVVMDPVFLLNEEEWDKIFGFRNKKLENYILVYDIMGNDKIIKILAKNLARIYSCSIFSIGSKKLYYAKKNFLSENPIGFINLVRNSKCVVSSSFHGTAFSIIYQKDFFVVERSDGLNDRMIDLLNTFGLKNRYVNYCNITNIRLKNHIRYYKIQDLINNKIKYSKYFLINSLYKVQSETST